jgi:hypothetical protein
MKIHYKDCTPEDIQCLERFEPEIQKLVTTVKGLATDVCWQRYSVKPQVREYYFFKLFVMSEPQESLGGDYGREFLERVSREEFFYWLTAPRGLAD